MKDQFKNFQNKVNKYVLREFDNPRDIIIFIQDIKDPYAHVDTDKPINISKQDKEDVILITQLQEEEKDYVKRIQHAKNLWYLWGKCTPGFQNKVQGDPYYDTNPDYFYILWFMQKLKLNSLGITHTSNPFHAAFHALNRVFNLRQGQTDSMDYFYKRFDSTLATCNFKG